MAAGSLAGIAHPVQATDLAPERLDATHQVARWTGMNSLNVMGVSSPLEQTCTALTCDLLRLDVEMPAGSFPLRGDGLLVSIRWASDVDQWNLYVDGPDGLPVSNGVNILSNAQSVLVPQPSNGEYTVRIVPFLTTLPRDLSYAGEARAYADPEARAPPGTPLLPRIETVAPYDFHIGDVPSLPSNPAGWRGTPDGTFSTSCYLDEQLDHGSTRCLRFSNDIRNVGGGPLILRFRYDQGIATHCEMEQEIQVVGAPPMDRNAGACVFHAQHGHFHYQNMARYLLYGVDDEGHPGGLPVAGSRKLGYCTIDVDDFSFGSAQTRPRTYTAPTCNIPNSIPARNPAIWEYMGISAGWGDIYTWHLPGQQIDISHIADGVYELVSRANPDEGLIESAPGLETGITCLRITGNEVSVIRQYAPQATKTSLPDCRLAPQTHTVW
jgi:hypothetical protein